MTRLAAALLYSTLFCLCTPPPSWAQIPETFTNLQVYPKDTPRAKLVGDMRSFSLALGVRCVHCHIGEDTPTLDKVDFAADGRATKVTARAMLRMVADINTRLLRDLDKPDGSSLIEVECVTCHRGVAQPVQMQALLARVVESEGSSAAVARYRSLRERYFGRAAYDFGTRPLIELTGQLSRAGKTAEAQPIVELAKELFPSDVEVLLTSADLHIRQGETAQATIDLERVRAIDPRHPVAERLLRQIREKR